MYTEPKLPNKPTKNDKETAAALKEYEEANAKNKFAIEQAIRHNKRIQKLHNKN